MAHKQLERDPGSGKVAGVLAGFANYFDFDVSVLRVVYIMLTVFTGIVPGILAYCAAAFVMPKNSSIKSA